MASHQPGTSPRHRHRRLHRHRPRTRASCCAEDGYDLRDRRRRGGHRDAPPRSCARSASTVEARRGRPRHAGRRRRADRGRRGAARSTRCSPTPATAWATASSTRTSTRSAHVIDTNVTGTLDLIHRVGRGDARARRGPHPDHRLDRRPDARHVPGRLQRHQGVHRLVLVRAAQRAEGHRRHRHRA